MGYAGLSRFLISAYTERDFRVDLPSMRQSTFDRGEIDEGDIDFLARIGDGEIGRMSRALIDKWGHLVLKAYPESFRLHREVANNAVLSFFALPRLSPGSPIALGIDHFGRYLEMMLFSDADAGFRAADRARFERLVYAAAYGAQVPLSLADSARRVPVSLDASSRVKLRPRARVAAFRSDVTVSAHSATPTFLAICSGGFGVEPTVVKVSSSMADVLYFCQSVRTVDELIGEFAMVPHGDEFRSTLITLSGFGVIELAN